MRLRVVAGVSAPLYVARRAGVAIAGLKAVTLASVPANEKLFRKLRPAKRHARRAWRESPAPSGMPCHVSTKGRPAAGIFADAMEDELLLANVGAAVVMVLATPEAEAMCAKNGLRLVEMFRPFQTVQNPNLSVQTTGEPYRMRQFRMCFETAAEIREVPHERAEQQIMETIATHGADSAASPPGGGGTDALAATLSPWWTAFREVLVRSLRHAEHAGTDHPVAVLLVAGANQPTPGAELTGLTSAANLPPLLRSGLADPLLARSYLLLHDESEAADSRRSQELLTRSGEALQEISRAFGASACHLITINSAGERAPLPAGVWPAHSANEGGALLSHEDIDRVSSFVRGSLCRLVMTALQQRVHQNALIVKEKRTGLKNTLRSWLGGRKGGDATPSPTGAAGAAAGASPRQAAGSIETYMRQLADFAFMLGDYGTALGQYRAAAAEFKSDRAWRYYAGAQEMAALCVALTGGSRREFDDAVEKATSSYRRLTGSPGDRAARHATRAVLLSLDALPRWPGKQRQREVAHALVSQSTHESNLLAAILLEQARDHAQIETRSRPRDCVELAPATHRRRAALRKSAARRCIASSPSI